MCDTSIMCVAVGEVLQKHGMPLFPPPSEGSNPSQELSPTSTPKTNPLKREKYMKERIQNLHTLQDTLAGEINYLKWKTQPEQYSDFKRESFRKTFTSRSIPHEDRSTSCQYTSRY